MPDNAPDPVEPAATEPTQPPAEVRTEPEESNDVAALRQEFEALRRRNQEIEEENERFADLLGQQQTQREEPPQERQGRRRRRGRKSRTPSYLDLGDDDSDEPDPREEEIARLRQRLEQNEGQVQALQYHLSVSENERQARRHVRKKDYPLLNEYGFYDRLVQEGVRSMMTGERGWDQVRWKRRLKDNLDAQEQQLRRTEERRRQQYLSGKDEARREIPATSAGPHQRARSEPASKPSVDWKGAKGNPFEAAKAATRQRLAAIQARRAQ